MDLEPKLYFENIMFSKNTQTNSCLICLQISDTRICSQCKDEHLSMVNKPNINLITKPGEIHLVLGPAQSGKSTLLHSIWRAQENLNDFRLLINHTDKWSDIQNYMWDLKKEKKQLKILLVDDAHLWNGCAMACLNLVRSEPNLRIYIAARNGDWLQRPFPEMGNLVSIASRVTNLNCNCSCGEKATFTTRPTGKRLEGDEYSTFEIPVCADCCKQMSIYDPQATIREALFRKKILEK